MMRELEKRNKENKYDYIIWDWNGTLYNDVIAGVDTINSMLTERGIAPLNVDRYREIFGFPIIDYYKKAGFDFAKEPYEVLAAIFIERNNARLGESELYGGALTALEYVKNKKIKQLVLSATRYDILMQQTGLFDIGNYFCEILGNKDFYAYGKTEIAKNWIAARKIDPKKVLFVGDTVHDFEVSQAIECDCMLICGGHQSEKQLKKTNAKILNNIKDVIKNI